MNNLRNLFYVLFLFWLIGCTAAKEDLKEHLSQKMSQQSDAWNRGDIESFMEPYWNSDSLLFIGGSGPQYGWQNTLERYQKAYPDKATMGKLSFEMLSFESFSEDDALISGKWHLKREKGDLGGYYSLLWKRINGNWMIVYDHTSSVKTK